MSSLSASTALAGPLVSGTRHSDVQALRGLALTMVFLVHWSQQVQPVAAPDSWQAWLASVLNDGGGAGTDLFILLAGVFTCRSLARTKGTWVTFMSRRLVRLYPLYLIVLAAQIGLVWLVPSMVREARDYFSGPVLAINVVMAAPLAKMVPIVRQSWTLTYILLFGLLMALAFDGFRARRSKVARGWVVVFVGAVTIGLVAATGRLEIWRWSLLPVGALVWHYYDQSRGKLTRHPKAAWVVALAPLALLLYVFSKRASAAGFSSPVGHWAPITFVCSLGFSACLVLPLVLESPPRWYQAFLEWKPAQNMGDLSFSFYLMHPFATKAFAPLATFAWSSWWTLGLLSLAAYCLAIGLAMLGKRYVESPQPKLTAAPPEQARAAQV